ncbi:MAG: hypothetical protein KDF55_16775 [Thauera sp.]|nr:hypothetical protein [Thauera sp.]
MDPDLIERYLQEHLTTIEAVDRAAGAVGVSRSTMYRLKANPRHIELGQLMELTRAIGMPIDETFSWLPNDFLAEERHRLGHEAQAAEASGLRMTVTPFFTVHAELPSVIDLTAVEQYEAGEWLAKRAQYHAERAKRRSLYESGRYESREIINGNLYRSVFFARKSRYAAMSEELKAQQVEALVQSLHLPHVSRRVYLGYDLPIVTWYSVNVAMLRVGEFSVQVSGPRLTKALKDVFNDYFARAELKGKRDVEAFLRDPTFT